MTDAAARRQVRELRAELSEQGAVTRQIALVRQPDFVILGVSA
jgi:hypothetical protein